MEITKVITDEKSVTEQVFEAIDFLKKEIQALRTDVDKLIENNNGGRYGRTA